MNRFKKKKRMNGDMELQITAMADIFTILLVFLLKSFGSSAIDISPAPGTVLPIAAGSSQQIAALKIEITSGSIQVESEPVATLKDFKFFRAEIDKNGTSQSLNDALRKARKKQLLIAQANSDVKVDPRIVIISDERAPYSTIKTVLASAAVNGFTDFKLAVVRPD